MSITKLYEVIINDGKCEWTETRYTEPELSSYISSYPYANITVKERRIFDGDIIGEYRGKSKSVDRFIHCEGCGKVMFYGESKVFESLTSMEDLTGELAPKRIFFCSKKCLTHYFSTHSTCHIEGDPSYTSIPWNIKEQDDE